jgi:hypothetical protein
MPETETTLLAEVPPLMSACCQNWDSRYDLKQPFVQDGFVWATDGRIMCRQSEGDFAPELLESLQLDRGKLPDPNSVWSLFHSAVTPTTEIELPKPTPCLECGGKEYTACETCLGTRINDDGMFDLELICLGKNYAALLYRHGVRSVIAHDATSPVYWKTGRIEGLLMPMQRD